MLKTKNLILCVVMQLVLFSLFFLLIVFTALRFGGVNSSNYILAMEISSYLSVMIAGFFGARIAWEKGGVYSLVMAGVWVVIRLGISLVMGNEFDFQSYIIKSLIILAVGFLSGVLGVAKGNRNYKF